MSNQEFLVGNFTSQQVIFNNHDNSIMGSTEDLELRLVFTYNSYINWGDPISVELWECLFQSKLGGLTTNHDVGAVFASKHKNA